MRNPTLAIVLLVLFGLVPIGAWLAMAASLEAVGLGRSIGRAILVVLAPLGFAGILMILGAAMFNRTRRAGRIFATVGAGIMFAGVGFLAALWLDRAGRCVEGGSYCTDLLFQGGGGFLYAIAHIVLIALVWRVRRSESPSAE
jgi:hypothetical protein